MNTFFSPDRDHPVQGKTGFKFHLGVSYRNALRENVSERFAVFVVCCFLSSYDKK
jgi:hypothetical protein